MEEIKSKITKLQNEFVQGEITHFTGNETNVLMESDVERISNSINTQLIDPVIDFVIACDDVITETASSAQRTADVAKSTADVADRTAGQSMSKATDALDKATNAESEADRANRRLDELKIPTLPNLDNQTWNWLPRSFDSVGIKYVNGISLANVNNKPHITWTPIRQNHETGRYFLEGKFEAKIKLMLRDWFSNSLGGHMVELGQNTQLMMFHGRINPEGLSDDVMTPTSISVNAYTKTDTQYVINATASTDEATSKEVKMSILLDWGKIDIDTTPIYVDLIMTFQRDANGNFGFGTLFPVLNPNSP